MSSRLTLLAATALCSFAVAAGATAALRPAGPPDAGSDRATVTAKTAASKKAKRGPRGLRGLTGTRGMTGGKGEVGPAGKLGPAGKRGADVVRSLPIILNWSDGQSAGRDFQSFTLPGLGSGRVVCNRDAQLVDFRPDDQGVDTSMWVLRNDDRFFSSPDGDEQLNPLTVRKAVKSEFSGDRFNEGMNLAGGASKGQGSFTGIISQHGRSPGAGEGPKPATFRLTWHWDFTSNPRCFVAGSFLTEAS